MEVCRWFKVNLMNLILFVANAEEIDDIEFTVTTLNCHNNQNNDTTEQTSPQHERKPRFSSFRKSGALSKAVRSRLNLTKSAGSTSDKVSEKHNNCSESFHSLDTEKAELNENGNKVEQSHDSAQLPPPSKAHPSSKVTKKRSKLCLLL